MGLMGGRERAPTQTIMGSGRGPHRCSTTASGMRTAAPRVAGRRRLEFRYARLTQAPVREPGRARRRQNIVRSEPEGLRTANTQTD